MKVLWGVPAVGTTLAFGYVFGPLACMITLAAIFALAGVLEKLVKHEPVEKRQ